MTMACVICNHSKRLDIDRDLTKGMGSTKIALKYGVQMNSVHNHKKKHLSRQMLKSGEMQEVANSKNLFGEVQNLIDRTKGILNDAEDKDRPHISLGAVRELRQTYEFLIKFSAYMSQIQKEDKQAEQEKELKIIQDNLSKDELLQLTFLLDKMKGKTDFYDYPYSEHRCLKCNDIVEPSDDDPDEVEDTTTDSVRFNFEKPLKRKKKKKKMKRKVVTTVEDDLGEDEEPKAVSTKRRLRPDDMFKGACDGSIRIL